MNCIVMAVIVFFEMIVHLVEEAYDSVHMRGNFSAPLATFSSQLKVVRVVDDWKLLAEERVVIDHHFEFLETAPYYLRMVRCLVGRQRRDVHCSFG